MEFMSSIWDPIADGGWVMFPLFILGLLIFGLGFYILLTLWPLRAHKISEEDCRTWIANPELANPKLREIIRYSQDGVESMEDIQLRFEEIRLNELPPINVNITVLNVMVNTAPLLGLLGTVLGMLTTFHGLAMGGTEQTTSTVAEGIGVALVTTEMGLILAIPGTFLVYFIRQMRGTFLHLLVRLESVSLQLFKGTAAA